MKPVPFDHLHPETPREAARALSDTAKIIAGGQSLGPMLNLRLARPSTLLGVGGIPALKEISESNGVLSIGAAVTHARIEDGDSPVPLPPMLRNVARGIAYRAVRNKGTVGGSMAHADPAADWVTAMTALDATIVLMDTGGKTRRVPAAGFMLGAYRTTIKPAEVITAVEIRSEMRAALWGYYKVTRKVGEFADAIGAFVVHPPSGYVRLVAGATGGRPVVLTDLAATIAGTAGCPADEEIRAALAERLHGLDPVKLHLLTTALSRAIKKVIPE
ncbi:FAD binding domain-containing protein [Paracoccus luteus]|uniref:FAD binding domain-containing protein n=1 Tax=Paracoccus luteus TaxID=2508543 RepID=UPI00106FCEDE|nr:FAD binding domain-containing protein [Paracoccus luteus]